MPQSLQPTPSSAPNAKWPLCHPRKRARRRSATGSIHRSAVRPCSIFPGIKCATPAGRSRGNLFQATSNRRTSAPSRAARRRAGRSSSQPSRIRITLVRLPARDTAREEHGERAGSLALLLPRALPACGTALAAAGGVGADPRPAGPVASLAGARAGDEQQVERHRGVDGVNEGAASATDPRRRRPRRRDCRCPAPAHGARKLSGSPCHRLAVRAKLFQCRRCSGSPGR